MRIRVGHHSRLELAAESTHVLPPRFEPSSCSRVQTDEVAPASSSSRHRPIRNCVSPRWIRPDDADQALAK